MRDPVVLAQWNIAPCCITIGGMANRLRLRRLKLARRELGWTQERLEQESGVERSHISNLENDKVGFSPETAQALARALGKEVFWLLGYDHPPDDELPDAAQQIIALIQPWSEEKLRVALAQLRALEKLEL